VAQCPDLTAMKTELGDSAGSGAYSIIKGKRLFRDRLVASKEVTYPCINFCASYTTSGN